MKALLPGKKAWTLHVKTLQRFMTNSREEYEAAMFLHRDMKFLKSCSRVEGLQPLLEAQKSGASIMLLTPHFDSYTTGIILMGLHGLRLNVMTTAMLKDPQVYPGIQAFFKKKIAGLERYMNGGSVRDYETDTRFFYQALREGGAMVIAADIPSPSKSSYLDVNFLGKRRKMAMGVTRIAEKTGSFLCAFACLYKGGGKYHLVFSPLYETGKGESRASIDRVYEFINEKINRYPERWWASDLMVAYEEITSNNQDTKRALCSASSSAST
jgi:lauroyl/myristoyl acyltransferase